MNEYSLILHCKINKCPEFTVNVFETLFDIELFHLLYKLLYFKKKSIFENENTNIIFVHIIGYIIPSNFVSVIGFINGGKKIPAIIKSEILSLNVLSFISYSLI